MPISISDGIAVFALILSAYAIRQTARIDKEQKFLRDTQEQLNVICLEKEKIEAASSTMTDINTTIIDIGSRNKRLKISNIGKSTARNIRILFPNGNEFVFEGEIKEKFPLKSLNQFANVELSITQELGTKLKQTMLVQWDDDFQNNREKEFCLTL